MGSEFNLAATWRDALPWIRDYGPWLIAGFLAGAFFSVLILKKARQWSGARYRKRGKRAEKKALRLLRKNGFRLIEWEPVFSNELWVDDQLISFEVTPDFLVEKAGQKFVVEVKSGDGGSSINKAGVRRQVLEYLVATDYPCLLVVPLDEEITQIELPLDDE